MAPCWRLNQELRPCFNDLEDEIYKLLERSVANQFVSMNEEHMEWNRKHFNPGLLNPAIDRFRETLFCLKMRYTIVFAITGHTDYLALTKKTDIPRPALPTRPSTMERSEQEHFRNATAVSTLKKSSTFTTENEQSVHEGYLRMQPVTPAGNNSFNNLELNGPTKLEDYVTCFPSTLTLFEAPIGKIHF